MADLRLGLVLLAACGQAGADSAGAAHGPAGWIDLHDMAKAAAAALEDPGATMNAWGDPAKGCYALRVDHAGDGSARAIADRIVEGLGGVTTKDVRLPDTGSGSAANQPGWLTLSFERAAGSGASALEGPPSPYRGALKARVGGGRIVVLACFANERDPAACEASCTTLLGGFQ